MSGLPMKSKADLYDKTRADVRQLIAGMVCREIIHSAFGSGVGFTEDDDATIERFIKDWRPVAFLLTDDGARMVDAERAAEVACGFAMDLGAAQAENERLREMLRGVELAVAS